MKRTTLVTITFAIAIITSLAYNIAYIPEIDTALIGYDGIGCINPFGDSSFFNPASLSFAKNYQLSFSYYDYMNLGIINLEQFYVKQPLKDGFAGLLSAQRTYSNQNDSTFDNWIYDYRFSSLVKNVSIGLSLQYITENSFYYEDNTDSNVSYITGDIGIITTFGNVAIGGLGKNFMSYKFNSYALDISPEYIFGIAFYNTALTMEVDMGKNLNEIPIWGGVSGAIKIGSFIVKAGVKMETDFKTYSLKSLAGGVRLKISNIIVDYAYKNTILTNSDYFQNNFLTFSFTW